MHRLSDIAFERRGRTDVRVGITLRTPEAAKALNETGLSSARLAWAIGSIALVAFAWYGGFGDTARGYILLTMAIAVLFWVTDTAQQILRKRNRMTTHRLDVEFSRDRVEIDTPQADHIVLTRGNTEIRFASRPHWRGRQEEREERRVGHLIGYEFRDAWEVWCEAGLDVHRIAAVSTEDDARAIVRHLTEANLIVTRGLEADDVTPRRTEPA